MSGNKPAGLPHERRPGNKNAPKPKPGRSQERSPWSSVQMFSDSSTGFRTSARKVPRFCDVPTSMSPFWLKLGRGSSGSLSPNSGRVRVGNLFGKGSGCEAQIPENEGRGQWFDLAHHKLVRLRSPQVGSTPLTTRAKFEGVAGRELAVRWHVLGCGGTVAWLCS